MRKIIFAALLLGLAPARAQELSPRELVDRLEEARRSTHAALGRVDTVDEDDPLGSLPADVARLDGARVRAGDEVLDVDPRASDEVREIASDSTTRGRRERLKRLERRLTALESEARRAEASAPTEKPATTGGNELRPRTPGPERGARESLERVLEKPRYRKRTESAGLDLSEGLESFEQRLYNWWIRFIQPRSWKPPAWLSAIGTFLASLLPASLWGWAAVLGGLLLLVILVLYLRARRRGAKEPGRTEGPETFAPEATRAAPREESLSEEHWRREARTLAKQGDHRGAVRALYTGVLIVLQRAGRLKFDKGKTNWEHVRELRRNDKALALRLEPLTRTFDLVWYGQKPIEPGTFDEFLGASDAFVAESSAGSTA